MDEERKVEGRINGEQDEPEKPDTMGMRLLYMIIIWAMLSLAQTVLTIATVIQFVIMLINNGTRNARLAEFGTDLGIWIAKAARYQTGASEVKPWPWTELD
jgi:succinate-acetate transporter protein